MKITGETVLPTCCFLQEASFKELYATFTQAFSDYVFPFALTEEQFRNHLALNGVDLERTAGCYLDGELVGFSLNGFGDWQGVRTVYDAGTGVIPQYRRRHVSEAMFAMMLPVFRDQGMQQCLLEVITSNTGAIKLYEKLGFTIKRELAVLQVDGEMTTPVPISPDIEVRRLDGPDWPVFSGFWDGIPSWQNSPEAIDRSQKNKTVKAAFVGDRCVGYMIYSSKVGRAAQMAVDREYRHHGVGSALLKEMRADTAEGYPMQIINVDKSLSGAIEFFTDHGFYERVAQFEMVLPLL